VGQSSHRRIIPTGPRRHQKHDRVRSFAPAPCGIIHSHEAFNFAPVVSATLFAATCVLWVRS
jgi:hypothetical protein